MSDDIDITITVRRTGAIRVLADWRGGGRSPWSNARRYAREHGYAGVLRADGSYRRFYRDGDGGRITQRTWRRVRAIYEATA